MRRHPFSIAALVAVAVAMCAAILSPIVALLAPAVDFVAPALTAIAFTVAAGIVAFGILRFATVISRTNVLAKVRLLAFHDDLRASAIG